ncbi:MAG: hypothetical protein SNJ55_04145 [Chloroherpetonaceae bacterium]
MQVLFLNYLVTETAIFFSAEVFAAEISATCRFFGVLFWRHNN